MLSKYDNKHFVLPLLLYYYFLCDLTIQILIKQMQIVAFKFTVGLAIEQSLYHKVFHWYVPILSQHIFHSTISCHCHVITSANGVIVGAAAKN